MYKSPRYDYARQPCYDKLNKHHRRKLHKTFRSYEKQIISRVGEFEPMPRRMSWG